MSLRGSYAILGLLILPLQADAQYATSVVQFQPGPNANPSFPASRALGGPQGGGLVNGSVDVCVLGIGGAVTLGFAQPIRNGAGADFIAYENGFTSGFGVFAEVALVEVSTDGANFARFPSRYDGPAATQPAFGVIPMGTFAGLVGGMPGIANVMTNTIDPRDAVKAGGEAFDLADLANDPLVLGGLVDLQNITEVRIIDVPAGQVPDSVGAFIYDNGGATGSADIDAVAAVHDSSTAATHEPVCDLALDAQGFLHLHIGDPDGFNNVDPATLASSINLVGVPFTQVLPAFALIGFDGNVAHFATGPFTGSSGLQLAFAVSLRDKQGALATDQFMIQD